MEPIIFRPINSTPYLVSWSGIDPFTKANQSVIDDAKSSISSIDTSGPLVKWGPGGTLGIVDLVLIADDGITPKVGYLRPPAHGFFTSGRVWTLPDLTGNVLLSSTDGVAGADKIRNIISLTQAEYDSIAIPDAQTIYMIV